MILEGETEMKFNSGEPELIHSLMILVEEEGRISILPKCSEIYGHE